MASEQNASKHPAGQSTNKIGNEKGQRIAQQQGGAKGTLEQSEGQG